MPPGSRSVAEPWYDTQSGGVELWYHTFSWGWRYHTFGGVKGDGITFSGGVQGDGITHLVGGVKGGGITFSEGG